MNVTDIVDDQTQTGFDGSRRRVLLDRSAHFRRDIRRQVRDDMRSGHEEHGT